MPEVPIRSGNDADPLARREIWIRGPIDDFCANETISRLLFLNLQDETSPIHLFIESQGGAVTAGLAIFDTLTSFVKAPVHTYAPSLARGMALWILAAGKRGYRTIRLDTSLSIEPFMAGASGETVDIESMVRMVFKIKQDSARKLASVTALSEASILDDFNEEGRLFSAAEAVAAGVADHILNV